MAGYYMSIRDKKENLEIYGVEKYFGRTHGCSCCSVEEEITLYGINAHIETLEKELKRSKKIKKELTETQSTTNKER